MTNPNYSFGLIKDMPNVKIEQKLILALRCPPEKILVWFIWKKKCRETTHKFERNCISSNWSRI